MIIEVQLMIEESTVASIRAGSGPFQGRAGPSRRV